MKSPKSSRYVLKTRYAPKKSLRWTRYALSVVLFVSIASCASTGTGDRRPSSNSAGAGIAALDIPVFDVDDFDNKSIREIDSLLGAPALIRKEGQGEFRRYAFASCAFILIFYPDTDGVKRVAKLYAGALAADQPEPDLGDCLARGPTQ